MPPQGNQCPFCQLISNPDQLMTVGETDNFYAWLEVNPRAKGHTMVVPKEHVENVLELSMDEWTEAFKLTREVVEKAKKGLNADGASVTVNIEEAGGQMLPHAYIQVFPRFQDDENAGTPTGAIFPQKEELQQQLDSIQRNMADAQVDLGDTKKTAHDESKKFKDSSKIDQLIDGGPAGSPEPKAPEEKEPEQAKEEESSQKEKKQQQMPEPEPKTEVDDLSRRELLQKLIQKYGGKEKFVESEEMKQIIEDTGHMLTEEWNDSEKKSFEWK